MANFTTVDDSLNGVGRVISVESPDATSQIVK